MGKYDISLAKRVVDLLGYELVPSIKKGYWIILDEKYNDVGYIEYDQTFHLSHIKISSPTVMVDETIPAEDKFFSFRFRVSKGTVDIKLYAPDAELSLCYPAYINIKTYYGQKFVLACHDFTELWETNRNSLDEYGLFLSYSYPVEEYDVKEDVDYANLDYNNDRVHKMYRYRLEYGSDQGIGHIEKLRAISNADNPDFLMVHKKSFRYDEYNNDELISSKDDVLIDKSVSDFAKEHGRGKEIFDYMRFTLNDMLPIKKDLFSEIFTEEIINMYGLKDFMEEKGNVK